MILKTGEVMILTKTAPKWGHDPGESHAAVVAPNAR
jgi:hypothetical protein